MPLWKVYHPAHAFSAEDKQELAERITSVYAGIPIPKFYAVVIFEELTNCHEGTRHTLDDERHYDTIGCAVAQGRRS